MGPIEKARAAERLRDDDLFREVIDGIRERKVGVFLDSRSTQEDREKAHVFIRVLSEIEGELKSLINKGQIAERKDRHRASD